MSVSLHVPVLADEVVRALSAVAPRRLLDATVGAGGHAELLLQATTASLLGVDRDPAAVRAARERLARFGDRATVVHGSFADLGRIVRERGGPADGVVADLGVSSLQIDEAGRGFSFRADGPLDTRMDPTSGRTLADLLAGIDSDRLADAIYAFGDERRSRAIARSILAARDAGRLRGTLDLAAAVRRAAGPRRGAIDPATRTFQALRILVNDEVGQLDALLAGLPAIVAPSGRVAIVSFHSVEDGRVKRFLRESPEFTPVTKKPIRPAFEETRSNPRARSGRLRIGVRA